MDAARFIESNLNPRTILEYYDFEHISETDDSFRACCKIHGGNNPSGFVWKKSNNLWFCYTGDCRGGDVFNLVQKLEHCNFQTAVNKTAEILGLDINGMTISAETNRIEREQKTWLQKQKKQIASQQNCFETYNLPFTKYYKIIECKNQTQKFNILQRFNDNVYEKFGAKFCSLYPTERKMLKDKIVIPIFSEDKCIGVGLRDATGTNLPKWYYQPDGIKTSNLLYNFDNAKDADEIILTEGIFDVWAYSRIGIDNAVAVFGSSISNEQYKMLMQTGAGITLSFDNDKAGNKCRNQAVELFYAKTDLKNIEFPIGSDPADCTQEQLLSAYLNRKTIQDKVIYI